MKDSRPGMIPSAPILLRIDRSGLSDSKLAALIWPNNSCGERRLGSIRAQETISFDLADRILCALGDCWHINSELEAIYEAVPLREIDAMTPTCLEAAIEMIRHVKTSHTALRTIPAVAEHLQIRPRSAAKMLDLGRRLSQAQVTP